MACTTASTSSTIGGTGKPTSRSWSRPRGVNCTTAADSSTTQGTRKPQICLPMRSRKALLANVKLLGSKPSSFLRCHRRVVHTFLWSSPCNRAIEVNCRAPNLTRRKGVYTNRMKIPNHTAHEPEDISPHREDNTLRFHRHLLAFHHTSNKNIRLKPTLLVELDHVDQRDFHETQRFLDTKNINAPGIVLPRCTLWRLAKQVLCTFGAHRPASDASN